jgi:hypothetical protein
MSPITREFLSESTDGVDINITTSGSPGTLIHTATSTAGEKDEIWLWGVNNAATIASVAIEWAGTDDNLNRHLVGIPSAEGDQLLIAGKTLAGGLDVRVYSTHPSASVSGVNIGGHVNRIS